jgi:hypothetical protein
MNFNMDMLKPFIPTITKVAINSSFRPALTVFTLLAYSYQLVAVPVFHAPALDQALLDQAMVLVGIHIAGRSAEKVYGVS